MTELAEALKSLQQAKQLLESRSEEEAITVLDKSPVLAKNYNLNCVLNKLKTASYESL